MDDDDSSGISSSDYGDVISGNVRRSDVKMGSRQPKATVAKGLRRRSAGEENSEAVHYSLQQINSDLARILTLLNTRPPAFSYPSAAQGSFGVEPVAQPYADTIRGPRVTPVYADSVQGIQAQSPYQPGPLPDSYHMRGAGVAVLPSRQAHTHNL